MTTTTLGIAGKVRPKFLTNDEDRELLGPFAEDDSSPLIRRELYDGRVHVVVPAVLAVAGVLNEALVSAEELARSVESWNGRDIPILHPEDLDGTPLSVAESPRILERAVGRVFNARMDGDKLKAELWIDEAKVDRLGYSSMLAEMMRGEIVELSTAYIADDVLETGEFRGRPYYVRHVNIRPDHLALLPGQVGACSIADGCGAPRINRRGLGVKVNEALETLAKALGIHRNCNCEACSMKTIDHKREAVRKDLEALKLHLGLKANEGLTAKHLKMLEELDERGLEMMSAMIEAFKTAGAKAAAADEPPATEDDPSAMRQNKGGSGNEPMTLTAAELDKLVSNRVAEGIEKGIDEALRRRDVTAKLTANEANPFSEEELRTLPLSVLEKTEKAIRPADYSGQGGFGSDLGTFAANATDEDDAPLTINRGVLAPPKKDVA